MTPLAAPTAAPVPTQAPVSTMTQSPIATSTQTQTPVATTSPPTVVYFRRLPLLPFALRLEGTLQEETVFRRDLELYLLGAMNITALERIALELTPSSFNRRNLQDATLLEYQGQAIVHDDIVAADYPTVEQVQAAQTDALSSNVDHLQEFLRSSSTQPVQIAQVRMPGIDPIILEPTPGTGNDDDDDNNDNDVPTNKNNAATIVVSVVVGLLVVAAAIGFFVWREHRKPPPPPPYELEFVSEVSEDGLDKHPYQLDTKPTTTTMSVDSNSPREEGMPVFDPAVLDLTRPATHANGMEDVQEEEASVVSHQTGDLTMGSSLPEDYTFQNNDNNNMDDDDTMAGFSLGSYSIQEQPARRDATTRAVTTSTSSSISLSSKPHTTSLTNVSFPSTSRIKSLLTPPKPRTTTTTTTMPIPDEEASQDENNTISSKSIYSSSYKEDEESFLSGTSEADSDVYVTPGTTAVPSPLRGKHGALGYFHRDDEDDDDDDDDNMLPPPQSMSPQSQYDSDAPTDELGKPEQDLSGFDNNKALAAATMIQQGLDTLPSEEGSEQWVRARRKMKKASRNKRADRKQPPVTMEV